MASTRRSSVLASLIDFLFISVRDSARAFLCRLLREMSKEPNASTHIFILIAKQQQHLRALLVEVLRDRIVCNPAFAIPRIKSVIIVLFCKMCGQRLTCRTCSPATSMRLVGSCFGRFQCCETSFNIWRSSMLLNNSKSYDRSFFNTWRHLCHTSISRVERHKYGIFITVAIDDPRSGKHSKIFHSRLRKTLIFPKKCLQGPQRRQANTS